MRARAIRLCLLLALPLAACQAPQPDSESLARIQAYAARADIRAAMVAANARPDTCESDNARWLAEYEAPRPDGVIAAMLARPLSQKLAQEGAQTGGRLDLIMVMDKRGCLIAANEPSHDLVQSDEAKFQQTIAVGAQKPLYEGTEPHPKGRIDQLSQGVYDAKGAALGVITLRWCPHSGGCGQPAAPVVPNGPRPLTPPAQQP